MYKCTYLRYTYVKIYQYISELPRTESSTELNSSSESTSQVCNLT